MADRRGREIEQKLSMGPVDLADAQKALLYGARTQNADLFIRAAVAGLHHLTLPEQRRFLRETSRIVSDNTQDDRLTNKQGYDTTKAFEVHGPELGTITPQELISILYDCVEDALSGKVNDYMSTTVSKSNGYWRGSHQERTKDKREILKKNNEAFGDFSGAFAISCSSPIRVYALHEAPSEEELEMRKKEREALKLKEKLEKQEAALKEIQEKERKLREELAKLEARQKRTKKNLEESKKGLGT